MTEFEKRAALQAGGWEENKPGQWTNTVAFDYRDAADCGKNETGMTVPGGRYKIVPIGVTRPLDRAYELEMQRIRPGQQEAKPAKAGAF